MQQLSDSKTETVAKIIRGKARNSSGKVLVVGCGSGIEAAILASKLQAEVIGVDVTHEFDSTAARWAQLQIGDALALDFPDNSFDLVYSYHALEHISDPIIALQEMWRVLKPDGCAWIGTPNRNRLLGYIGSKDATFSDKLRWNLQDWRARLAGQFRNELGAHAGFSNNELRHMLAGIFSEVDEMSNIYYENLYAKHQKFLGLLRTTGFTKVVYPSVYFLAGK